MIAVDCFVPEESPIRIEKCSACDGSCKIGDELFQYGMMVEKLGDKNPLVLCLDCFREWIMEFVERKRSKVKASDNET